MEKENIKVPVCSQVVLSMMCVSSALFAGDPVKMCVCVRGGGCWRCLKALFPGGLVNMNPFLPKV